MRNVFLFVSILQLLWTTESLAQTGEDEPNRDPIQFSVSSQLLAGSSNQLPFHLHTNRLGTVDPNSTNFLNRIQLSGVLTDRKGLTLDYGTDLALRVSQNSTAFFPELYLGAEYGAFRLDAGRFDRPIGLNNHNLSIGSMMVSRNAVPIPRIMISNPEFTDMPWTNGILEFKGMYSHGWFTDERFMENSYLHQKYLYLKVNIDSFSVTGGIVHNMMWGGSNPELGVAPQSLNDYLRVVFALPSEPKDGTINHGIGNSIGNSLAAYEFDISYQADSYDLSVTRLFYLEDSVSKRFRSPWDGVWGVNLTFDNQDRLLNAITYEHINTKRQDAKAGQQIGRANYYNHAVYRSGWMYEGRIIGIPLITWSDDPDIDQRSGREKYVVNNIIIAHHAGISGSLINRLDYRMMATYSRNYGTATGFHKAPAGSIDMAERREDNLSLMLEFGYTPKNSQNLQFNVSAALDTGEFYGNRLGGELGIRYTFE